MNPILSDTFPVVGNGLGGLPDAIECIVSHEINGIYELQMRYPVTGLHFDEIESGRFIMAKPDDLTPAQPFRVYRITKPLNGVVTVYARHICYDMQGIVVEPFSAGSLTEAFQTIPTVLTPANSFIFQTTRSVASGMEIKEPRPLWKLLGGQAGSILDVYGGEWDFDGYNVKLVTRLGIDRGVTIRYGKNMTDLEQDATIEAAFSGVYPFWYDEETGTLVTLTEKFVTVPGAVVTDRVLSLDCSDDFDTQPTEQDLRDRANAYISANSVGNAKTSWKVSFVSSTGYEDDLRLLEQVQLGDTLGVHYERMGVNATARAVKTEYDVLADRYKAVTIGRVKQSLAQIIVDQQERTESQFAGVKSDIEHAVDSATDFIKHGEGYMRFIYNASDELTEIVSLDDPDITQALSVWRWNNGGFGHSSTGYNGPYTLAITQNGAIVADFITAGTLNANVIRAGILQDALGKNSWNLDTGALTITDGAINIETNSSTDDRILLNHTSGADEYSAHISPSGVSVATTDGTNYYVSTLTPYTSVHSIYNDTAPTVGTEFARSSYGWGLASLETATDKAEINSTGVILSAQTDWANPVQQAELRQYGLAFYNSSGTNISNYDAGYHEDGGMYSIGTSWTGTITLNVIPGLYAISAGLAYSNSQPRGVAIVATASGSSTDYNLAVNENYASIAGRTVSWLWCGTTVRITGTTNWDLKLYAKSANAGNNRVYMFAKRIG